MSEHALPHVGAVGRRVEIERELERSLSEIVHLQPEAIAQVALAGAGPTAHRGRVKPQPRAQVAEANRRSGQQIQREGFDAAAAHAPLSVPDRLR